MLKAFTPVAVLIWASLVGLERTTSLELNIVAIISVGVALTSIGEEMFSMTGFTFQALSVLFESGRLVMTNIFLKELGLDSLSTLYYIAPLCAATLGFSCLVFEFWELPFAMMETPTFWMIMVANGMIAFSLNIASVLLIKHTSALTLTLAGIVKDILLVMLSILLFGSPVSVLQYLGYSVSLLALNLHKEYKKNRAAFEAPQHSSMLPTTAATTSALAMSSTGSTSKDQSS